jgi:hypothetical protein
MALPVLDILDGIVSPMLASGLFSAVNKHEPKSAPAGQLTAAVWLDTVDPAPRASGMAATAIRLGWKIRLYFNMLADPQDEIDPELLIAQATLMGIFSGDFDLGQSVRNIDLQGEFGPGLSSRAGYLEQDRKLFRIIDITLPLICNDVWEQTP